MEHSPKEGQGALALPTMGRGVIAFKIHFYVVFFMEKDLYSSSNDFSFLNQYLRVSSSVPCDVV
jgi:hypothetical protein